MYICSCRALTSCDDCACADALLALRSVNLKGHLGYATFPWYLTQKDKPLITRAKNDGGMYLFRVIGQSRLADTDV